MMRTGSQRDPLIVDGRTGVVLDGMHRRATLQSLGARFAICAEFDYLDSTIKLARWVRYLIAPGANVLKELISKLQLKGPIRLTDAIRKVNSKESAIALLSRDLSYVAEAGISFQPPERIWESAFEKTKLFDSICQASDETIEFAPDSELDELFASTSVFVLYYARLDKKVILELAKRRMVLPFKTTRHILPLRPMGINFPLNDLLDSSESVCEKKLESIVKGSVLRLEKRSILYEGRRYKEPLAIFERKK